MNGAAVLAISAAGFGGPLGRAVDAIRGAGPGPFFLAMALLPALGVPVMAFSLAAGSAFSARMGLPGVIAACLGAVTANLLLTYWLAGYALRPGLARLLVRLGHRPPQVPPGDQIDLIVLLRVTPGVPFFVQNYLLGLSRVPLGRYLLVSCASSWCYTSASVLVGDGVLHGRTWLFFPGAGLVAAALAGTHLARRHCAARKRREAGG